MCKSEIWNQSDEDQRKYVSCCESFQMCMKLIPGITLFFGTFAWSLSFLILIYFYILRHILHAAGNSHKSYHFRFPACCFGMIHGHPQTWRKWVQPLPFPLPVLTELKCSVNHGIDHGIGHAKEEDPQAWLFIQRITWKRVQDENNKIWSPAHDECKHNHGSHA